MTLVLTRLKEFQKPTHLHSHLLFATAQTKPKKAKESASQRTQTVQQFSANLGGHSFGQTEGQLVTAPTRNWRFCALHESLSYI